MKNWRFMCFIDNDGKADYVLKKGIDEVRYCGY